MAKYFMRYFKIFPLASIVGLITYGCDPCKRLECAASNYSGQLRIVSAADGKDLVFGPNKVYDIDRIQFYSLKGTDTTFFESNAVHWPASGHDSILHVFFFPKPDTVFMQLSNGDVDTLKVSYNTFDTKCCGTITEIENFRFNNTSDLPGNQGTQELRK